MISARDQLGSSIVRHHSERPRADTSFTSNHAVRAACGLLLLSASLLKTYQLVREPLPELFPLRSQWLAIVIIQWELLLGIWLLTRVAARGAWRAAMTTFAVFATVSLWKALAGDETCGCFGYVPVTPWLTLSLDLAAVLALITWGAPAESKTDGADTPNSLSILLRPNASQICLFVALLTPSVLIVTAQPATLSPSGQLVGDGPLVVLEPAEWVGKRFPLLKYLDMDADLASGRWTVVLYHDTCPRCQELLPAYMDLALSPLASQRFAFVEVSPEANELIRPGPWLAGRLINEKDWFVTTPVEIVLEDGVVRQVKDESTISKELSRRATSSPFEHSLSAPGLEKRRAS